MGNVYTVKGRLVQGDPYGMTQRKDDKTGALRVKADGTPMMSAFVALAVPKTDPQLPTLMAQLDNEKKTAWPQGQWQHAQFATKIEDGDSQAPNKKGKKNCDREGFPGNMIFKFSNGYAPKVIYWDAASGGWKESIKGQVGPQVKIGDFATIVFDIDKNNSDQSPGMYMNHKTIGFEGEGAAIAQEADYSSLLGTRSPGGAPPPNAAHVASPPPPVASPPPSTIAVPGSGPVMTAAAKGVPYESYIASGWDDATLIANGMMLPPAAAPVAAPPPAGAAPPPPYAGFMETPPAPVRIMLPKARGVPYESYVASGWTDAQLIEQGMMAPS